MRISFLVIATLVSSLYLTGCAKNNIDDDIATRQRNTNEITRVNFNNPNQVGPAISSADTSDPELDRNRNYNTITNGRNNKHVGSNQSNTRVADTAADKVINLTEVDNATVIINDNNAYVAAKLDVSSRNELTSAIKEKIARAVKSVDRNIDNVYISVNPDFYDRMNAYSRDIRNGRPVSGFIDEFSDTIRRVFPNAK
ncbi:YhcN/YlaJ family sporulation lipoprotein [Bacillus sp. ISL-40]|uniref:YhcN/YlaJ family sporulation lipoprotein n=1 Tax=unclassified Bacillus (in: firmicutes) TaxID=185979 RepID=UPI001BEBF3DD|nr:MULTISPECIES: YhcN/YlaJ family sporulation lipoprotein [unclassified Bacillus (in: firmicutes)]MBT2699238.1 YhcN/YlaJ family sporulation lipoprotein [Bacillus sp. ISL-40]MBT2723494.1 YhcN/YlaJ family sporulation lipoprotein [Bacillus sp. ISL-46]MBT2739902.1 YhcN/YlaJ family sporulation lipoprotein [Bacillus sp. ISL-77]